MSVLPDSSTYDSLGGTITDYDEAVDPTTDLPASADNETRANVAGMTRMTRRVWFLWTNNGSTGTIVSFDSVVGNSAANYPTIEKQTTGQWRFTFPATATDEMGVSRAWSFKHGYSSAQHSTPIHMQVKVLTPNIFDVYIWVLPAATANDAPSTTLCTEVL